MQPCRTPEEVWNGNNPFGIQTFVVVPVCRFHTTSLQENNAVNFGEISASSNNQTKNCSYTV